ncbi:MAG: twin-arginine translocase TatA/TatE family subunit [Myxococcota bacterium]|nr:twin-arginine translocase TatA/TatE family subunit [Myxococcota bacterium]
MNVLNHLDALFAIGMPGGSEMLILLIIVLIVFGHNRIPQLGEALGKGIKNFKKSFAKDEQPTQGQPVQNTPITESKPAENVTTVTAETVQTKSSDTDGTAS